MKKKKSAQREKIVSKKDLVFFIRFRYVAIISVIVLGIFSGTSVFQLASSQQILGASTTQHSFSFFNFFSSVFSSFTGYSQTASPQNTQRITTTITPTTTTMNHTTTIAVHTVPQKIPPQAAIAVCSGLATGTSCSFNGPNGTISGTCQTPPGQTITVCVPRK